MSEMDVLRANFATIADVHCYNEMESKNAKEDRCDCGHQGMWHLHLADMLMDELEQLQALNERYAKETLLPRYSTCPSDCPSRYSGVCTHE